MVLPRNTKFVYAVRKRSDQECSASCKYVFVTICFLLPHWQVYCDICVLSGKTENNHQESSQVLICRTCILAQ